MYKTSKKAKKFYGGKYENSTDGLTDRLTDCLSILKKKNGVEKKGLVQKLRHCRNGDDCSR